MMANLRTILWGANLLLVAVVAYAAAVTTSMLLEKALLVNTPAVESSRARGAAEEPREKLPLSTFDSILDVNMFRAKRRPTPVAALAPSQAPSAVQSQATAVVAPPSLNLTLTGTFVTRPVAYAFVAGPSSSQEKVYAVGDCIPMLGDAPTRDCAPNQGVLKRVLQDRIVVVYQGQDVILELVKESEPAPAVTAAVVVPGVYVGRRQAPEADEGPTNEASVIGGDPFPATQNGNQIEVRVPNTEVESAFENFSEILKQARVVPFAVDGEAAGFKILRIRHGSIFQRLGLQNNDVIERVNGESLSNADQALRLFSLFKNEREVVLDVQRNNQPLHLSYIIE
jgi:general secretion pathway protein C